MAINPENDKVYTYCYITKAKQGFNVSIIATIDGIKPEIDAPLVNWLGSHNDLMAFLFLLFKNPIIKDEHLQRKPNS